ncbi:methyltransferase [Actibacterium mucosum KCTC 23349]|uniref:Methyltransferase n=1 Tax=Actibacterium mucosum KCTC 23349 TaxID=1454373 RepID=A0A037ZI65_9RHOB|nr:L-histidine N(alpha)-methyltransferase [Actibacterium mucosum]KAJ55247.1 methyltransferase [Actibacterium mucosum KCTC 23349]
MDKSVVDNDELLQSALQGLGLPQKRLDSKWFYDHRGSELFEEITQLPEYYPTRTETAILREHVGALAKYVPQDGALFELGSGASVKTRILLDDFDHIAAYLPSDISAEFLGGVARDLVRDYPDLDVVPVVADFMGAMALPAQYADMPKAVFFPGSTIGNLEAEGAVELLSRVRMMPGVRAFILGADLVKDTGELIAAYDDAQGVTAAFNLNVLRRLNAECGADFDLTAFAHEARWNQAHSRIEMHLVSRLEQTVVMGGEAIRFAAGESIHTENSHKYTQDRLAAMAARGGWRLVEFITDRQARFSVSVLIPV